MMRKFPVLIFSAAVATAKVITSDAFRATIDDHTGALVELVDPQALTVRNWVSSSSNAPWQPSGSRWGLGYFDAGASSLHRQYWTTPHVSCDGAETCLSRYPEGPLEIAVQRKTGGQQGTLTEKYVFKNTGSESLNLASKGAVSFCYLYTLQCSIHEHI